MLLSRKSSVKAKLVLRKLKQTWETSFKANTTGERSQNSVCAQKKKKRSFKRWGQGKVGGIINHLFLLTELFTPGLAKGKVTYLYFIDK